MNQSPLLGIELSSVLGTTLLPIETLMNEHRIIEQIIPKFTKEIARIEESNDVNVKFIEKAVDFLRTYADHTHHGKEEGILFRELRKKPISDEHRTLMMELIEDHVFSRKTTTNLGKANAATPRVVLRHGETSGRP